MSLPSSASSRFMMSGVFSGWSGLSPSSTGRLAKSGFRSAALNASAMIAASAPENGTCSPALPDREMVEAPSLRAPAPPCPVELWRSTAAAPAAPAAAPVSSGELGWLSTCAIIGDEEPIEFLFDSICLLRIRRIMKKARMHVVAMARNPRTTMTAIAHRGKSEPEPPD
jgi:hypothetical protein